MDIELSSFVDVDGTAFLLDPLEGIVDLVIHCTHSINLFFGHRGGEFIVVVEVYGG